MKKAPRRSDEGSAQWEGNDLMHHSASAAPDIAVAALRRAAVRAVRAPSVHNSQPWRLVLDPESLTVVPDRTRQLSIFDPTGRQLLLSCGCAAANAQISLAAEGAAAEVDIRDAPDPWPTIRVTLADGAPDDALAALDPAIDLRATPRTAMTREPLSGGLRDLLGRIAADAGADLGVVRDANDRAAVDRLARLGTRILCTYPEYLSELRSWTTGPARADGLPPTALAPLGGMTVTSVSDPDADSLCDLVWIATPRDEPRSWVSAGMVLERVLLELACTGLAAVPLGQVVEVPTLRAAFASLVGTVASPQVILRVGRAPSSAATRRRRLVDVIA